MTVATVSRNDANYESSRVDRIFNRRRPDRTPIQIVFPTTESEIEEAVHRAEANDWRISVRSGGHSVRILLVPFEAFPSSHCFSDRSGQLGLCDKIAF